MSLYGTRDAPQNWQEKLSSDLEEMQFQAGVYNPCIFYNQIRDISVMVHGDDYVAVGAEQDLQWLQTEIRKRYDVKVEMIGPEHSDQNTVKVLNRIITFVPGGILYEADPRHAELLAEFMGLENANLQKHQGLERKRKTKFRTQKRMKKWKEQTIAGTGVWWQEPII